MLIRITTDTHWNQQVLITCCGFKSIRNSKRKITWNDYSIKMLARFIKTDMTYIKEFGRICGGCTMDVINAKSISRFKSIGGKWIEQKVIQKENYINWFEWTDKDEDIKMEKF